MKLSFKRISFALFILVVVGLCVHLGLWQVERLQWKQGLLDRLDIMEQANPWNTKLDLDQVHDFSQGWVEGEYLEVPTIKVGPRVWNERMGAHALTPFKTDCCVLWVNRGWVPEYWQEQERPEGKVRLAGVIQTPELAGMFTPENYPQQGIWYWTDLQDMNVSSGLDHLDIVKPFVLTMTGQDPERLRTLPNPVQATMERPHNRHLQYAIFWFSMAGVLMALGVCVTLRR